MLMKICVLLAGVVLTAGCAAGLTEADVDARIDSAVSTAIAGIPSQPTIFTAPVSRVRAQSYEIVDPINGLSRAAFSLESDGRVRLKLLDANGVARAWLVLSPENKAAVVLADSEGAPRTGLTVAPNGDSQLLFQDELGNAIASYP